MGSKKVRYPPADVRRGRGGGRGSAAPPDARGMAPGPIASGRPELLPLLLDLLVVAVEAGLGFSAALRAASERLEGALGQEMRLALQEQPSAGLPDDLAVPRDQLAARERRHRPAGDLHSLARLVAGSRMQA